MRKAAALACAALAGLATVAGVAITVDVHALAQARSAEPTRPFTVSVRRLTESQYRHLIADTFGEGIVMDGRFEPEMREEGLQAIGNAHLSVTSSGFEQYFSLASSIATQVLDPKNRDRHVECKPADPKAADSACTRAVIERYGRPLFRRSLTEAEIANRLDIAARGTAGSGDYYEGLRLALASLLIDPEFLFRVEAAEPDPGRRGQYRLDANSKVSRLSFLLWDAGPDEELLKLAASGDIHKDAVLRAQVARMTSSPRLRDGAEAFFTDMFQFEHFESLTKDAETYPKYSQKVADSAREQTLRTTLHHLVDQERDYRDLFTSNETFINRALAAVYKVPYRSKDEWSKYTFPAEAERSGLLTDVTFLSLFSHPAASSPTKRGAKIHEIFMCQPIPEPPADVDFSAVQALDKGTVRTRLLAHMDNEGCAGCHKITDPMGLALEHFDGLGQRRTLENGALIDVSGEIHGQKIVGAPGLGKALREDPSIPACLVRNVYAYGIGRAPEYAEEPMLAEQARAFARDNYRFKALVANIASSPDFYRVAPPEGLATVDFAATRTPQGGTQ